MVQYLKSLFQTWYYFLLHYILDVLDKLFRTNQEGAINLSMMQKRKPMIDKSLVKTMTYKTWKEIPNKYKRALGNMHHKIIDGLMYEIFTMDDKQIDIIKVYLINDHPVAWYTVAQHSGSNNINREACFWVQTKLRGRGLGKEMWDDFFNWVNVEGHKKNATFNLYDGSISYYRAVKHLLPKNVTNFIRA